MSKHIFFISSYPKSGNTLMRLIITSLFFTRDGIVNFENLKYIGQLENKIFLEIIRKLISKKIAFGLLIVVNTHFSVFIHSLVN